MIPQTVARSLLPAFLMLVSALGLAEDRNSWQQPERVVRELGVRPGSRVADIGCGQGYFTLRMAKAVGPAGVVFAADIDAHALDVLKAQADRQLLTNVVTVVSDFTETKLSPECADVLLICDVLHEMPQAHRQPMLNSAVRALTPGGYLYLIDYRKSRDVTFDPYEKLIPKEDLVMICTDAGLRLDAEYHYLKYQVFLRFHKPAAQ